MRHGSTSPFSLSISSLDSGRALAEDAPVRRALGISWLMAALLAGCAAEPGHAPIARPTATPRAIPERDSYQTDVQLDGTASADPIDDPDGERPLSYRWEIVGDDMRIAAGRLSDPRLTVRLFGARPATVLLTVTDEDGRSATARLQLQLTVR
jgi:hypothetical protein